MMMPTDDAAPNQALPRDGSDRSAAPLDDSHGMDSFPAFREYLLAPKIDDGAAAAGDKELDIELQFRQAHESPARRGAAAARMRRHRSETAMTMDGRGGSARRVPDGYRMRDVPGDGRGEEGRNGSPRGGRSERPSMRKSASERLRLRRMLLEESLDCSMEGDASGAAGNSPPYKPHASTSQQSLRESANENHRQDLRFPKHRSYSGSTSNRRALPTSNEEWPEVKRAHEPPRANGRPLSLWESRRGSFDRGANGRAGTHAESERRTFNNGRGSLTMGDESLLNRGMHPFNSSVRRSSAPDMGGDPHGRSNLAGSTNSAGSASLMAEHIALKLKVAELQSELQVTQSQAKNCSVGLRQAEEAMERLREDNARLSKQNSQLAEENAFLVSLLGPREAERLRKYRERAGPATNAPMMEKRRHSSYQPVRKSRCRSGDTPQPNKDNGEKDAGGKTPQRRRSSWWTKRRSSMPAATPGNSDRDAILQDFPPADDSVPPRRSSSHKSFGETAQSTNPVRRPSEDAARSGGTNLTSSLAEWMKNIPPKQQLGLEGGGVTNERKEPKHPVPQYIQFGGGDEATLRCSDISLSERVEKLVGEASNERRIAQHRMSDIDERESKYNRAPAAADASPREKGERAHAASGTVTNSGRGGESEVESHWLWHSSGPLAYSVTEHASVQEGGDDVPRDFRVGRAIGNNEQRGDGSESLPLDEDESWNQSFAYSSVGAKSVDESAANKADAARVEI